MTLEQLEAYTRLKELIDQQSAAIHSLRHEFGSTGYTPGSQSRSLGLVKDNPDYDGGRRDPWSALPTERGKIFNEHLSRASSACSALYDLLKEMLEDA